MPVYDSKSCNQIFELVSSANTCMSFEFQTVGTAGTDASVSDERYPRIHK